MAVIGQRMREDFRSAAAMAVASAAVEKVAQDRLVPKQVPRKIPPPVVRAVVLVQACLRRKAFLRSFEAAALQDKALADLAPPAPLVAVALYMCRRLRNPSFVDIGLEARFVSGIVVSKENVTMDVLANVVWFYEGDIPDGSPALITLKEKLQVLTIQAHEVLAAKLADCQTPAEVYAEVDHARRTFKVLPELEAEVFSCAERRMEEVVREADKVMKREISRSVTTLEFEANAVFLKDLYGPVNTSLRDELKVAHLRRVQFLERELETRWSRPFAGPLPPHTRASQRYTLELGRVPKVEEFREELKRHQAVLEAQFDVKLHEVQAVLKNLTARRRDAKARSLVQDLDAKLSDATVRLQHCIEDALVNLGPDNQKVADKARLILSLEAHTGVFAMFAESQAEELRRENELADPAPEAADRRRGIASALHAALNELSPLHPFQEELRFEFREELSATDAPSRPCSPLDNDMPAEEEPASEPPVDLAVAPCAAAAPATAAALARGAPPLSLPREASRSDSYPHSVHAAAAPGAAFVPAMAAWGTPPSTAARNMGRKVERFSTAEESSEEPEAEDLWLEPMGFEDLHSKDEQVHTPEKFRPPGADGVPMKHGDEPNGYVPDPRVHMMMQSFNADSLAKEQTRLPSGVTAQLTLQDLTMEVVHLHTEQVFASKFRRAIADACSVPRDRIQVLGFEPGSVKVLLRISEPAPDEKPVNEGSRGAPVGPKSAAEVLQELTKQVADPASLLRLGEVGPFISSAVVDIGIATASKKVEHASLDTAYMAPPLGASARNSSAPVSASKPGASSCRTMAWTGSTDAGCTMGRSSSASTAWPGTGSTWAPSLSPSSVERQTGDERAFRTTCPRDPEKHLEQSAAWAVPYARQGMYTFYNQTAEEVHPRSLDGSTPKTKPRKEKFTPHATFCLTRHPISGVSKYRDLPAPQSPTIASADSWLDSAETELKDPGLFQLQADWPDFKDLASKAKAKDGGTPVPREREPDEDRKSAGKNKGRKSAKPKAAKKDEPPPEQPGSAAEEERPLVQQPSAPAEKEEPLVQQSSAAAEEMEPLIQQPCQLAEAEERAVQQPSAAAEEDESLVQLPSQFSYADTEAEERAVHHPGDAEEKEESLVQLPSQFSYADTEEPDIAEPEPEAAEPEPEAIAVEDTVAASSLPSPPAPGADGSKADVELAPSSARSGQGHIPDTSKIASEERAASGHFRKEADVESPSTDDVEETTVEEASKKKVDRSDKKSRAKKLKAALEEPAPVDTPKEPSHPEPTLARNQAVRQRPASVGAARDHGSGATPKSGAKVARPATQGARPATQGARPAAQGTRPATQGARPATQSSPDLASLQGDGRNLANSRYAGMLGGIPKTGVRHQVDDEGQKSRLPDLIGKESTDDLRTPAFMSSWFRHSTVGVGPPYRISEEKHEETPAWTAMQMLDATLDKNDWHRSYGFQTRKVGKVEKDWAFRGAQLGPERGIRQINQKNNTTSRSQSDGAVRDRLPPVNRRQGRVRPGKKDDQRPPCSVPAPPTRPPPPDDEPPMVEITTLEPSGIADPIDISMVAGDNEPTALEQDGYDPKALATEKPRDSETYNLRQEEETDGPEEEKNQPLEENAEAEVDRNYQLEEATSQEQAASTGKAADGMDAAVTEAATAPTEELSAGEVASEQAGAVEESTLVVETDAAIEKLEVAEKTLAAQGLALSEQAASTGLLADAEEAAAVDAAAAATEGSSAHRHLSNCRLHEGCSCSWPTEEVTIADTGADRATTPLAETEAVAEKAEVVQRTAASEGLANPEKAAAEKAEVVQRTAAAEGLANPEKANHGPLTLAEEEPEPEEEEAVSPGEDPLSLTVSIDLLAGLGDESSRSRSPSAFSRVDTPTNFSSAANAEMRQPETNATTKSVEVQTDEAEQNAEVQTAEVSLEAARGGTSRPEEQPAMEGTTVADPIQLPEDALRDSFPHSPSVGACLRAPPQADKPFSLSPSVGAWLRNAPTSARLKTTTLSAQEPTRSTDDAPSSSCHSPSAASSLRPAPREVGGTTAADATDVFTEIEKEQEPRLTNQLSHNEPKPETGTSARQQRLEEPRSESRAPEPRAQPGGDFRHIGLEKIHALFREREARESSIEEASIDPRQAEEGVQICGVRPQMRQLAGDFRHIRFDSIHALFSKEVEEGSQHVRDLEVRQVDPETDELSRLRPADHHCRINAVATRDEVLNYAQSLTSNIFRNSNSLAMRRAASQPQFLPSKASEPAAVTGPVAPLAATAVRATSSPRALAAIESPAVAVPAQVVPQPRFVRKNSPIPAEEGAFFD